MHYDIGESPEALSTLRAVRSENLSDPCITAGDRAYLVGSLDGYFADRGWHIPHEMGGLWAHPIKLVDGFWLSVDGQWLPPATNFEGGPYWCMHHWDLDDDLSISRHQFVPDGIAGLEVRYTFRSGHSRHLSLRFLVRVDLQSVWASDHDGIIDGDDEAQWDDHLGAWLGSDRDNPWTVVIGGRGWLPKRTETGRDLWGPERTEGRGTSVTMELDFPLEAGATHDLVLVMAGSHLSNDAARADFLELRGGGRSLWAAKTARYKQLLRSSSLITPDQSVDAAWDWVKCNLDWLVRDVPSVGRGLGAGVDDYPWWFGTDSAYSVLGALAVGQHEVAIDTLDLIRHLSERANGGSGRVLHEANTRGQVVHPGCTQETLHFASAVWETFRWTGDLGFLRRSFDFCRRGVLDWVVGEQCRDGDLMPHGYGIIEVEGLDLQCVDTAAHVVTALGALAEMARVLGDDRLGTTCDELCQQARAQLEARFWLEGEGLYADMLGTPAQMASRLDHLLHMSGHPISLTRDKPEVGAELRRLVEEARGAEAGTDTRGWLLKNWTVIYPVVEGVADVDRAARVLDRAATEEFSGPWGTYLSGIDRTHQMSISTGALAVAEIRYGRADAALSLLHKLTDSLQMHMPGAISEMSPDYGCFVQAWSTYAITWPIVWGFFGIQPDAHLRHLTVSPCFPISWTEARLEQVRIGLATFDFYWNGSDLQVVTDDPQWTITTEGPRRPS